MLSEISEKEKDKYHIISLMWNVNKQMNKQNKTELTDIENRLVAIRVEGGLRVGKRSKGSQLYGEGW